MRIRRPNPGRTTRWWEISSSVDWTAKSVPAGTTDAAAAKPSLINVRRFIRLFCRRHTQTACRRQPNAHAFGCKGLSAPRPAGLKHAIVRDGKPCPEGLLVLPGHVGRAKGLRPSAAKTFLLPQTSHLQHFSPTPYALRPLFALHPAPYAHTPPALAQSPYSPEPCRPDPGQR